MKTAAAAEQSRAHYVQKRDLPLLYNNIDTKMTESSECSQYGAKIQTLPYAF